MSSSSSIRAFGAFLHRFSNGVSFKCPNSSSFQRIGLLARNLPPSSSSSSSSWVSLYEAKSANTEAQNAKKAKLFSKIGKEVVCAVKKGGPNPVSNTVLAGVLEKAKELDVPKEILERNIKRASEKGQESYIEKLYEVYGFGGVSIVVEVLTDKINRSVAAVREVVKDCGGKMADPGSVMFKFRRARVVNIKATDADRDQLLDIALDAGADDVIEPPVYEDDTEEDGSESFFSVDCKRLVIDILGLKYFSYVPTNEFYDDVPWTQADDEAMDLNKELMSKLLELDDVDAVYTDQK
ncbi:hypothetical protein L1049_018157 [Liquidambar formosana]|uniref:Uncharacterized protein n=1 Tax=Liquidambar formosana TaxID=63359 RepID=A0AAP0NI38_LIQFO